MTIHVSKFTFIFIIKIKILKYLIFIEQNYVKMLKKSLKEKLFQWPSVWYGYSYSRYLTVGFRKLAQEWLTLIGSLTKETTTSDGEVRP